MSQAIAPLQTQAVQQVSSPPDGGDSSRLRELMADEPLVRWAEKAKIANGLAMALVKTSFVPESLRVKRNGVEDVEATRYNISGVILTGEELGFSPMASLRSIDIVKGTPAMRAMALRALVQSNGHKIWVVEESPTKVVVQGQRRGLEQVETVTWTMERAKSMGLARNDNYQKQPQTMLVARATSDICRRIAADVIMGVPYSVEELQDGDVMTVTAEPVEEVKPKRVQRKRAEKPAPPPLPELTVADMPSVPAVEDSDLPEDMDPVTGELLEMDEATLPIEEPAWPTVKPPGQG